METKFTIYLGLNDKDTKQQEITTLNAYKIAVNIVGDCSISELTGYYTHNDNEVVIEKSLKIEVFGKSENEIKVIAEQLKTTFNQECVIIQKQVVDSLFI